MTTHGDPRVRVWGRLLESTGLVEQLDVLASPVLARGSITFGQLTAVVGLHGAGKSYLLSALAEGLPRWQTNLSLPIENSGHPAELSGEYRLSLRPGTEPRAIEYSRPIDWSDRRKSDLKLSPLNATILTPFIALNDLQMASQEHLFLQRRSPVDLKQMPRGHLEALRAITGHEYQSLEYGNFGSDEFDLPFFRGVRGSRVIDMGSMSSSEFWVHYVLAQLHSADSNEVVLIDEPESFLAQPGHRAFLDEIARLTLASGCQTIIATHSETMLRRIPSELLRQVTQSPRGALISEVTRTEGLFRAFGQGRPTIGALVFVEDELATGIVQCLLDRYAPERADVFEVIDSEGKDQALRGASVARGSKRLRVLVLLDADQRDENHGGDVLYLPGAGAPESELLKSLGARELEAAQKLRVTVSELRIALDAARFVPHQRVFMVMSSSLAGCTSAQLRDIALDLWLESETIDEAARTLVARMVESLPAVF